MAKNEKKSRLHQKFITPPMIASYPNVFEKAEELNGDMKYSISLIIDKGDVEGVKAIKKAIGSAAKDFFGEDRKKWPKGLVNPLRDGDEEEKEGIYEGKKFMKAKSTSKPSIVDKALNPIIDKEEFYPGCKCRVSVNFFGYDTKGKKGVAVGLNHVMKVEDGERLDSRTAAEDDFADFVEAEDDDLGEDIEEIEPKTKKKKTTEKKIEEAPADEEEDDDEGFLD